MDNIIDRNNNELYYFYIKLQYGNPSDNINELPTKKSKIGYESNSSFLHPVIIVMKNDELVEIVHFDEELFAEFEKKTTWHDRIFKLLNSYKYF